MKRLHSALFIMLLGTLGACGGSSGGDSDVAEQGDTQQPPEKTALPQVTTQSALTAEEFLAVVEADASLKGQWTKLQGQGATSVLRAGVSKDEDGVEVHWGEVAEGETYSGLLRYCATAPCTGGAAYSISKGQLTLDDPDGIAKGIGLPILLKQLAGHTYDKPTEVVKQGLDVPTQLPSIDVSKRHAYLISSFGDLWAAGELSLEPVEELLDGTGAFDTVTRIEYAQVSDVDDALLHAHPFDVMLWLGQTVLEEVKTNQVFMPVGLTVNSGVYGDKLYDRDRLEDVLALNPLQGPGVVVLAGCDSIDDGNGGGVQAKSMPTLLDNGARVVVGFVKCGDARDILYASQMFLDSFVDQQKPLGEAVAAVNAYLESLGGSLRMATLPDANQATTFLKDTSAFWDQYTDAGVPADSFMTVYVNVVNRCAKADGTVYQEEESFATAWTKTITWNGPFFSGSRTNPDNNVDITITGALTSLGEGAHFFFMLQGDLGPKVNNLTLYGNADVQAIVVDKEKPEQFTIQFTGQGVGSEYTNEQGDTCIMQNPFLSTTTGEPSTFVIPVPWKAEN